MYFTYKCSFSAVEDIKNKLSLLGKSSQFDLLNHNESLMFLIRLFEVNYPVWSVPPFISKFKVMKGSTYE